MSSQQKALYLNGVGKGFSLKSTDIYKPESGEILIKVKSTALNPIDWKLEKFNLGLCNACVPPSPVVLKFVELPPNILRLSSPHIPFHERTDRVIGPLLDKLFPIIAGCDAAGEVVEVGEGVEEFVMGDRVLFDGDLKMREDTFQQYAISPAFRAAKIPSGWSYDQASTIPTAFLTAWMGLYHNVPYGAGYTGPIEPSARGKYADTPIVILGGATSVAQYAIQLAKYSGFSPIITTASVKHEPYLKSLGATHVLDRTILLSELPSEIAKITNKPIDLVFDSVSSADTQQAGYDVISETGTVVILTPLTLKQVEGSKETVIRVSSFVSVPHNVEVVKAVYAHFTSFAEAGHILPNRPEVVPGGLNGIVDGLKRLENNQVSGVKLVVHPEETA